MTPQEKMRIVQELVPGKQITLAHIIAHPDPILYVKMGLTADEAETADAIGPRQAGNGHKYADGAVGQGGHRGSSFGWAVCAVRKSGGAAGIPWNADGS